MAEDDNKREDRQAGYREARARGLTERTFEVGILTPVTQQAVEASSAWQEFLGRLNSKISVNPHWKYGNFDNKNLADNANQLLQIKNPSLDLIVADGTTAARIVQYIAPANFKIVQIVGGDEAPGGNLTGFHINAKNTLDDQLNRLLTTFKLEARFSSLRCHEHSNKRNCRGFVT